MRCITEINKENLSSCKDLLNIVDELRHIDGIKDKKDIENCLVPLPSNRPHHRPPCVSSST